MTLDFNQPLLEHCPFCDYALEGLPEKHVCPECGQPFDRRWAVFGGKPGRRPATMAHKLAIVVGGIVTLMAIGDWVSNESAIILQVLGCAACLWLMIWPLAKRARRFVAVGPEGIALGDRSHRALRKYGWDSIRSVDVDSLIRLRVYLKGEVITWSLAHGSGAEDYPCVECINKHLVMLGEHQSGA